MFSGLSPIEWISVTSFSLSLAAMLARFITRDEKVSAKSHLLTAVVILAISSGALATINSLQKAADVDALAERIYIAIGNQEKTTDQILIELGPLEVKSFSAALALLQARHRIESSVEKASLYRNRQVFVRLWRALPK
jgi:hypothetical protein